MSASSLLTMGLQGCCSYEETKKFEITSVVTGINCGYIYFFLNTQSLKKVVYM